MWWAYGHSLYIFQIFLFIRMFPEEKCQERKVFGVHPYTYIRYNFTCDISFSKRENCNKLRAHATYSLNTCLLYLYSLLYTSLFFSPFCPSPPSHAFFSLSPTPLSPFFLLYAIPPHQPLSLQLPTHSYPQVKLEVGVGNVAHK